MGDIAEIIGRCPVCGELPDIDVVEPWPKGHGPAPFYAAHYSLSPVEHTLGCNADTEKEARKEWNRMVRELAGSAALKSREKQ